MLNLQKLLRRMKELAGSCLNVHFEEKERRVLGIGVAVVVAVSFIALPFSDRNAVHVQAAAVGDLDEELESAQVQGSGDEEESTAEDFEEATEVTQADSDYLNIPQLKLAASIAGRFGKAEEEDDVLTLFGEEDVWTEDMLEEELLRIESRNAWEEEMENQPEPTPALTEEEAFYASVDMSDIPSTLTLSYNAQYRMELSAEQLNVLEIIVEAEAGDEDAYGKILVANVVLNRVLDEEFPDTIKEVVFQNNGTVYQFSPVRSGGRYYTVTVSEHTRAAVARALNGEDYSEGALYFFARRYTSSTKAKWFDTALRKITEYGCHEFFGNK